MDPKVDAFIERADRWKQEFERLRTIALDCGLTETLKWGVPCYTFQDNNIVLIHGFKEYCALLFHQGALLKDPHRMLIRQTENVQAARQLRFTSLREIEKRAPTVKAYIDEAVEINKSGRKVPRRKTSEYPVPDEFRSALEDYPDLKAAFEALTPGRQRAYLLHFSQPKQAKTRRARVERWAPHILSGKGLNDR